MSTCICCNQPWPQGKYRYSEDLIERQERAVNATIRAETALDDMEGLLVAALCVMRFEADSTDTSEEDRKNALSTLIEYARGARQEAAQGGEAHWDVAAEYIWPTNRLAREAKHAETPPEQKEDA